MAITYTTIFDGTLRVPVLHTVMCGERLFQDHYRHADRKESEMREWLTQNCKNAYYMFPGWHSEYGVQFEDDADATLFALRWANG